MRVAAAVMVCFILAAAFSSAPAAGSNKVIFIIADGLELADITSSEFSNLYRISSQGSTGLLCTGNTRSSLGSVYAAASAGAPCSADDSAADSFSIYEPVDGEFDAAGVVFERRMGIPADSGVVNLGMQKIIRYNSLHCAVSLPGALGEAIKSARKRSAVFGNSDVLGSRYRFGAVLAADSSGLVPIGDVSNRILKKSTASPAGFVTDVDKLCLMIGSALSDADFIVVDFGDIARVERMRSRCSDSAYRRHRQEALRSLDRFLGRITCASNSGCTIFLASFMPRVSDQREPERLSPIVIYRCKSKSGLLFSSTTRTLGLVSIIDIAPTVLAELDIRKPPNMMGCVISALPGGLDDLRRLDDTAAVNSVLLRRVLGIIAAVGIFSLTILCAALIINCRLWWAHAARFGLILSLCSPVGMLFAGIGDMQVDSYAIRLALWTFITAAVAYAADFLVRRRVKNDSARLFVSPLVSAAIIVCVVLLIDSFFNGRLARFTLLSAGDFSGLRFYGIGNEYMGLWLGMLIVSIIFAREILLRVGVSRKFVNGADAAVSALTIFMLGHPAFGANAGGAIAAAAGLWLVYVSGVFDRIRLRDVLYGAAAGVVFVILLGLIDMYASGNSKSHIGLTASAAKQKGLGYLASVVVRKLEMNFSLLGTKQAAAALWGAVPFVLLWFTGVEKAVSRAIAPYNSIKNGLLAGLLCLLFALLFNDSGVVSAGIILACLAAAAVDFALFGAGDKDANSCA